MFNQLGLIGCGLMGGSFALALKRAGLVKRVIGYSKSPSTTERAQQLGVIDVAAESALLAVSGLRHRAAGRAGGRHRGHASRPSATSSSPACCSWTWAAPSATSSTPRAACYGAHRLLRAGAPDRRQGRPGIQHADAALYNGRQVILTPLPQTAPELVQKATDVWSAIGAQVLRMTPENHDAAFAAVSHLPHLLAFAYFSAVVNQPAGRDFLSLAGPGFRDFTRIAASDPTMWRDILMANREEILKQSQRFRHALDAIEHVMRTGNAEALEDLIRGASDARARLADGRAALAVGTLIRRRRRDVRHPFLDLPPLRGAAGTRAPAGLQEHLQPRAAAGRPGRGTTLVHDLLDSDDTRVMLDALRTLGCTLHGRATARCASPAWAAGCAVQRGRALPRQRRHRDAPADRRAGRAGRARRAALRADRRAAHARAADRRPGRRAAPARLPRSTTWASRAIRRCA